MGKYGLRMKNIKHRSVANMQKVGQKSATCASANILTDLIGDFDDNNGSNESAVDIMQMQKIHTIGTARSYSGCQANVLAPGGPLRR